MLGVTQINVDAPGLPSNDTALLKIIATQLGFKPGSPGSGIPVAETVGFLQAPPGTQQQVLTYYGVTNNVKDITYTGGTYNVRYNLAYVGGGAVSNDNLNLVTITLL